MVGQFIRNERKARNLTLADLSRMTGLSVGFLSSVERGKAAPSLNSLQKIAKAFGIPMFRFLLQEESGDSDCVVRRHSRKVMSFPMSRVTYELLVPDLNGKLNALWGELDEKLDSTRHEPWTHDCEEWTLVLSGTLEVRLGDRIYVLNAGDAIRFDANVPHLYRNGGSGKVTFVSVTVPPTF